ncbi:tetratricopeptide repeat protein [Paraburkholderia dinghuensis]|uniref:protein O-GlcNAc transferase n=1 Tax=Paraburkholderia dinghuensis TaxID=2305225 RepID=A0A3N6NC83_9BURK|nr:tetratricopeptide repeat protein [Paraburkholderia dinghuensis]RQH06067.1 glycosyltransferase [Paraburkholderia dinghuensis]
MTTAIQSNVEFEALARQFEATIERLIAVEDFRQAEALARQMTQLLPDAGYGWKALAFLRLVDGDLPGAYEPMCRCMTLLPADTDLQPHWSAVRAAYEQAVQPASTVDAQRPTALPTREQGEAAIALFDTGRLEEALAAARALVEQFPEHPLGWKMLALTLYRLNQHQASDTCLQRAHELIPDDRDILQVYAARLEAIGNHADAERVCRRLIEIDPAHAEGTRLLGVILMATDRVGEAEPFLLQAAQLTPQSALAWNSLGSLYLRLGRIEDAAQQFLRSLDCEPHGAATWSNLLFCLTHSENVEPDALLAAHRGFAEMFEAPFKAAWPHHTNTRELDRVLRIGFVSADLRRHAVANFLEPILTHLARDAGLRLYAYSNTVAPDAVSERLRTHFAVWRDVSELDNAAFTSLVKADEIDILIDLSGHTGYNRLPALALKPAPVQASWIGYPGTTGLTAIDYFFADRFWAPSGQFETQFTEKIVYLPAVAPFLPEQEAPPLNTLPALRNGYVTFGSFNRINKLQRNVIALWAQLLRAVPDARLKIAAMPADGGVEAQLSNWFAEEGIARERLDFHPRTSVAAYLQLHHEVDIALDTFPFGGLTTALQSLWMGVPTLTLTGRTLPGRSGATVMSHAGLERFVSSSAEDFAQRGATLAADLPALAELRARMRERCAASPMFQPAALAQNVSAALRTMWHRWCAGLPAVSFDTKQAGSVQHPRALSEKPIRLVCGTRGTREHFFEHSALGRSVEMNLQRQPGQVQVRLFDQNTLGLSTIYNVAIEEARQDPAILVFVHDDVWLTDLFWTDRIAEALAHYDIAGLAGNRRRVKGQVVWSMTGPNQPDDAQNLTGMVGHSKGFPPKGLTYYGPSGQECKLLDGLMLIVDSETLAKTGLRFDEQFNFHFYDLDFCRQAERRGLRMGTWPISAVHESAGQLGTGWAETAVLYLQKYGEYSDAIA